MRISDWSSDVCSSDLAHGDKKSVLAPDEIADAPEHERAERPDRKARRERRKREDEAGGFVDAREELRRNDRREQAVEVEIIPFEHRAERRGKDDLAFALPGFDGDRKSTRLNSSN